MSQINRCLPKEAHPTHELEESFFHIGNGLFLLRIYSKNFCVSFTPVGSHSFDSSSLAAGPIPCADPPPNVREFHSASFLLPVCSVSRPTRLCCPRPGGCQDYEAQTAPWLPIWTRCHCPRWPARLGAPIRPECPCAADRTFSLTTGWASGCPIAVAEPGLPPGGQSHLQAQPAWLCLLILSCRRRWPAEPP